MDAIERTFAPCNRLAVKPKSEDELKNAVLSEVSASKASIAPTGDDLLLLKRSVREAATELRKLVR
jgi:hypothetical protein